MMKVHNYCYMRKLNKLGETSVKDKSFTRQFVRCTKSPDFGKGMVINMKVVILAGGLPSTITEEKEGIPKPMAEIGGRPILWHIMQHFSYYGFHEFIICGGYKVNMIKDYFKDFYIYQSDITVDLVANSIEIHNHVTEDWKVTVVNTGLQTVTMERVAQIKEYIKEEDFMVTYGDCLSDIDMKKLCRVHGQTNRLAIMSVARPMGRNTTLAIDNEGNYLFANQAIDEANQAWVNACTYVFNREIFDYLDKNKSEEQLLRSLAEAKQITTYKHTGFWTSIETKRERMELDSAWNLHNEKWKTSR